QRQAAVDHGQRRSRARDAQGDVRFRRLVRRPRRQRIRVHLLSAGSRQPGAGRRVGGEGGGSGMKDFVTVLFRRRRHVAAFFLFMAGVPVLLSYVLPPRYQATASLLLTSGREKKPFVPTERDSHTPFLQVSMEDVGSEVEILLSRPVLAAVVDAQHLDQECHPDRSETARWLACSAGRAVKASL